MMGAVTSGWASSQATESWAGVQPFSLPMIILPKQSLLTCGPLSPTRTLSIGLFRVTPREPLTG
jgi:hypothetical protein